MTKTNNKGESDWFDELTEAQQKAVLNSLDKLDNGEGVPHEEAIEMLGLTSYKTKN